VLEEDLKESMLFGICLMDVFLGLHLGLGLGHMLIFWWDL